MGSLMQIGLSKETFPGETRVALIPAQVDALVKAGHKIVVEKGAGTAAGYADEQYQQSGAQLADSRKAVFEQADLITQVRLLDADPDSADSIVSLAKAKQSFIAFTEPFANSKAAQAITSKGATVFSMELVPRISRAQSMDALSSMATIAGYKAVLLAANALPKILPMMMTAAGTLTPAKVLVLGVGVAGLQAIATAKRLGAVVSAYDVRPAVKEQVESLGGKFVELDIQTEGAEDKGGYAKAQSEEFYRKQQELLGDVVAQQDVVITTAAVPGKKAPMLMPASMVKKMAAGSVIVDMAAERGGNCELTKLNETIETGGVTIIGPSNLPASIPLHASQMYSKNVVTLINHVYKEEGAELALDDEIVEGTLFCHGGEVISPLVRKVLGLEKEEANA